MFIASDYTFGVSDISYIYQDGNAKLSVTNKTQSQHHNLLNITMVTRLSPRSFVYWLTCMFIL